MRPAPGHLLGVVRSAPSASRYELASLDAEEPGNIPDGAYSPLCRVSAGVAEHRQRLADSAAGHFLDRAVGDDGASLRKGQRQVDVDLDRDARDPVLVLRFYSLEELDREIDLF